MALSRRGGRSRFTLVFLLLTSATVITLDFRDDGQGLVAALRNGAADAFSPVRSVAADVLDPVGDALAGITGYGDLEDENAALRARIAELEGDVLRDEGAEEELAEALSLLELDFAGDRPRVDARVVSAPVSNFEQTIELDRGSDDGVSVDMPVVTGSGLIGRTVAVSGSRSVVQLITDPVSSVGVRLSRSSEVAVAEGRGPDALLSLGFVDAATEVDVLELVVTSGLEDSIFPPGIPVGRVARAEVGAGQFQQRVEVRPVADISRLTLVSVITG
ncbi:MAG: rod shape-determining protein MreC [Actinobacteria bacterium]|nr:rod shape-determining protein MreC [Actinomycetota bacterium]